MRNTLTVDKDAPQTGTNYQTIQAAVNAAIVAGASISNDWLIEISIGSYTENVTTATGIHLVGRSILGTKINGTLLLDGDSSAENLAVLLSGSNPANVAVKCSLNTSGDRISLNNVFIQASKSVDAPLTCLQGFGAGAGMIYVRNCYLYSQNHQQAGVNAKCVLFHIVAESRASMEVFGCHGKTSPSRTGVSESVYAWVEPSSFYTEIHVAFSDWAAIYAADPVVIRNQNTKNTAAMLDVTVHAWDTLSVPRMDNVSPQLSYYNVVAQRQFSEAYFQRFNGSDYPLVPVIAASAPPTAANDAPEGTIWLVG